MEATKLNDLMVFHLNSHLFNDYKPQRVIDNKYFVLEKKKKSEYTQ